MSCVLCVTSRSCPYKSTFDNLMVSFLHNSAVRARRGCYTCRVCFDSASELKWVEYVKPDKTEREFHKPVGLGLVRTTPLVEWSVPPPPLSLSCFFLLLFLSLPRFIFEV